MSIIRIFCSLLLCLAMPAHAFDFGALIDNGKLGDLGKAMQSGSGSGLSGISNDDQIGGLKQALTQAAETAVKNLSKKNGYLGNDKVRIPLPGSLKKVDDLLHQFGMGQYGDDLRTSINRAAEAAVPEAKKLLVGAVKGMTIEDAKGILTGGDNAATQYFRSRTEAPIAAKFRPIIEKSMKKVGLAQKYDEFAGKGAKFGLVDQKDANLDDYITRRAMDGLFLMMSDEEKAIRSDPLKATGNLAKKVFSAVK